ncbi:glycosyltransferase [Sphingomonas sp. A2-49]|uniref:glycosyltransferase n=1 Tax=Sphingomonas sp. A2-49 TaxID=1391375 RepID=UPI0021D3E5E5|nr:glycosyltransferase [Sphingomonas sp. A2-49]MCU6454593.1 glycosyltransferase [Sphingomonas sp. A2-49]
MRIVDVNEFYSPTGGGVRTYVDRKIEVLAAMGHELIVLAPGREDRIEERPGGGAVHYIKAPGMPFDANYGLFWDAEPLHRRLDALDPDVVENCSPWRAAWIVADWRGRAIRSFFLHNDNLEAYPKRWFKPVASAPRIERAFSWYDRYLARCFDRFDTVVTNGPSLTRQLSARGLHVDATMPLGIERAHFSPSLRDEGLRAALLQQCGLPPHAQLLLGVGRHHPEKRWPTVIDAVHRAGTQAPVGLVILGQGMDTKTLEKHIGDTPHIRLFQPVYDRRRLATIMASADAYIHGCGTETFGLVPAEALASGTPLIVPDGGGTAEIADPLFAEVYVQRDAHSCADAILRMLARERAIVRRAAAVAAASVRSDEEHAADLVAHYAAVIAAKDQPARRSA